jgi:hypothetical protein
LIRRFLGRANLASQAAGFVLEGANAEIRTGAAIAKIGLDKRFEPAAAFALGDVDELVQKQFPLLPAIRPNNDSVADRDTATRLGDNLSALRRLGQFLILGQRDPINHEDAHPGRILNARSPGIGELPGRQWDAVLENVGFLRFRPLKSERRQTVKFFLIDHCELGGKLPPQGAIGVREEARLPMRPPILENGTRRIELFTTGCPGRRIQ